MDDILSIENRAELETQLCNALGVDITKTKRIIIDLDCQNILVMVYVEMYASNKILDVDWGVLGGAKIKILEANEAQK